MKEYKRFIYNSSFLSAIIIAIILISPKVFAPIISEKNHYIASTIDKENRLKNIKSPKIILIGGSGTAYSINSKTIEDTLKMPVVNMAVAYGVGLTFMLEEIKNEIKEGDKIIIFPEYDLPLVGNTKLLTLLNDLNPEASKYYGFNALDWLKFGIYNFQRVGSSLFYKIKNSEITDSTTLRTAFDSHGDMIAHLNLPKIRPLKDAMKLYNNNYSLEIEAMNQLVAFAKTKKAIVFYSFPAYPKPEYFKNKNAIQFLEQRIKGNFKGQILNNAEENVYEESDFYDTIYHLNKDGRSKRSQYLAILLKAEFSK